MAPPLAKKAKLAGKDRVIRACDVCRKRKVKCDGDQPCSSCMTASTVCIYNGVAFPHVKSFYHRDNDLYRELRLLYKSAKALSRNEKIKASGQLCKTLTEIENSISNLQSQVDLDINDETIADYDGEGSLERQFIETSTVRLNRFSNVDMTKNNVPNITPYFGIYSTLAIFSKYGFSWMFKKLMSYSNNTSTRETMYIYMKFLDMAQLHYEEDINQKTTPIEWCFDKYAVNCDCKTLDGLFAILNIQVNPTKNDDILTKDVYEELARRPIEFFSKLIEYAWETCYLYYTGVGQSFQMSSKIFELEDIMTCLALEFSSKILYADMHHEIIIPATLRWVRICHWHEEIYTVGKFLACAIRRALDLGLNSWEYYISLPEVAAEKNRLIWWECYWWDKWFSLSAGKSPLIDDAKITCLLPRRLMESGLDESMTCLEMMERCNFRHMSESEIRIFGYIMLGKYIEYINSEILFKKEYTDYRLFASVKKPIDVTINKFYDEYRSAIDLLNKMENFFVSLTGVDVDTDELTEFMTYFIETKMKCLIAMGSLIYRLKGVEVSGSELLDKCLKISLTNIYQCSLTGLRRVSNFNSFLIERYLLHINLMILNLMLSIIESPENEPVENILLMCNVVHLLGNANALKNCSNSKNMPLSELICRQSLSLSYICCRVYVQLAVKRNSSISEEEILRVLQRSNPHFATIYNQLNDISSDIFKSLLELNVAGSYQAHLIDHFREMMGDKILQKMKQLESEVQSSATPSSIEATSTVSSTVHQDHIDTNYKMNGGPAQELQDVTFEALLNSDSFASVYTDFLESLDLRKPSGNDTMPSLSLDHHADMNNPSL
ncbi:Zn(2)-C6 fungal-type DNA-binding domain profile [Nakaseomyces glabratus]|nr:Zn(2)-C6 fungal-type DNA-binding domain profile [Nakaseomyces glabratus]